MRHYTIAFTDSRLTQWEEYKDRLKAEAAAITNRKNELTMLNGLAKRLIDKDVKTLIKGGLMDNDLNLTADGKAEVWYLLFEQFKKDLVKVAEERIAERKEKA